MWPHWKEVRWDGSPEQPPTKTSKPEMSPWQLGCKSTTTVAHAPTLTPLLWFHSRPVSSSVNVSNIYAIIMHQGISQRFLSSTHVSFHATPMYSRFYIFPHLGANTISVRGRWDLPSLAYSSSTSGSWSAGSSWSSSGIGSVPTNDRHATRAAKH
jgi:hypothetical protein